MPTLRISQLGIGLACMIGLAACGVAEPPAAAPTSPTTQQGAAVSTTLPTTPPTAAPAADPPPTTAPAPPTAIPTPPATQPPTATSKETIVPDQSQPTRPGRATLQPVATLQPEGAAPATPPAAAPPVPGSVFASEVEVAKADLARRRAVAPDTIQVLEVRTVTWPDPGLGCPQPGMGYKQVPVDGLLIRLESGGQIFEYHSGGSKAPFLCEQLPGGKATPVSGGESR